ncbi:hypothetical protein Tco_0250733 [Tanacetum coccineum]
MELAAGRSTNGDRMTPPGDSMMDGEGGLSSRELGLTSDRLSRRLIKAQTHHSMVYHLDPSPSTPDIATAIGYSHSDTASIIKDMRRDMSDMQAELLALREPQKGARQPGPEARIPDHQDAFGDADSHI